MSRAAREARGLTIAGLARLLRYKSERSVRLMETGRQGLSTAAAAWLGAVGA